MVTRRVRWIRLGVRLLLAAWALGTLLAVAGESFPVEHREPITVRVLNGGSGGPLAHARLTLIAGYSGKDIAQRLWREEVVTGTTGEVRMPAVLGNFPFLQVRVAKTRLCQETARGETYRVEQIRASGVIAPNRCGIVVLAETPRMLVVFARGIGEAGGPVQAPVAEDRVDFAAGASPETDAALNELSPSSAPGRRQTDVFLGRALVSVAAKVGARQVEARPDWAVLRSPNEIDVLMARQAGVPEPAAAADEGTTNPAGSYEEMCQPED